VKLTSACQEALLALLCYDEGDGAVASAMVEASHFDPVYREVAELALDYRQRFKMPPGTHTEDLFDTCVQRDEERTELYERLFESLKSTIRSINAKYVLSQARHFVRHQTLKRAMAKAVRDLARDDEAGLEAAESTLHEALKAGVKTFDAGLQFLDNIPGTLQFLEEQQTAFPTGIPAFDQYDLGPARGRTHIFVGWTGSGKSWWLQNLATRSHQSAKRVLYVTLELTEAEVSQRLIQSFFGMSKRQGEVAYHKFVETPNEREWGMNWDVVKLSKLNHFDTDDVRSRLSKRIKVYQGGERLIIKSFPMGTLTPRHLEAYLDALEERERFVPDLLCIDYVDIMKRPPKKDRWEGLLDLSEQAKKLGQERSLAVATVSQTKVTGKSAGRVDLEHGGGSWDKFSAADTVFTYSRTDEEHADNLARIFVAKGRSDRDRFEVMISQAYTIGQFALSSTRLGEEYYKAHEDKKQDDSRESGRKG